MPPGTRFEHAGYVIDAGLVYVGRKVRTGQGNDPSLIDPTLRVSAKNPDVTGRWLDYWPDYSDLRSESRAAYLAWLAGGRRDAQVPIGYAFLFMYGLERRVFIDIPADPALEPELEVIRDEMRRLVDLLGERNASFRRYGTSFIDVIDLMILKDDTKLPARPPELGEVHWDPPTSLVVRIGQYAADRQPVPVDWALAWAWFHPRSSIRTAATRCVAEFAAFFAHRYAARFGYGLVPTNQGGVIRADYWAASMAITEVQVGLDGVKDVLERGDAGSLVAIVDEAHAALDAYSRFIGKQPDAVGTLRAEALLPVELLELEETAPAFRRWLSDNQRTNVDAGELLTLWKLDDVEKASKADSVLIAQLAHKLGHAIEPDPRFGGPVYQRGSAIRVFAQAPHAANTPSLEYQMATTAAHLAVAVGAADGEVEDSEVEQLLAHVRSRLDLSSFEVARLSHHAAWLSASPVKLTGLTKRINSLGHPQREALGGLMIDIALADGVATPDEIKIVTKVFKLLGLDESSVTGRLHQAMTGQTGPVLVRTGTADAGTGIPARPADASSFVLDPASVERKRQDTASVSALLRDIFHEDEPAAPTPRPAPADTIAGLDASHSSLVRAVQEHSAIDREWLEERCAELGLLPDGALDTLNELAFDVCDEPLIEGDGPYDVNPYALEEIGR